jgi:hypothetical protein
MNGRDLTNIQLVFVSAAREWYRLLLTLSHADEGSKLRRYADLAEKCAFFFSLVVIQGMDKGWKESELSLEAAAICSFTASARPNFRSFLGLTYLSSLSACCFPDSDEVGFSMSNSQQQIDSAEGRLLQEILLSRSFEVSKSLWRWATGVTAECKARRSMLMALECLSSCCVFSSFATFMHKLDPITRYKIFSFCFVWSQMITVLKLFITICYSDWHRCFNWQCVMKWPKEVSSTWGTVTVLRRMVPT